MPKIFVCHRREDTADVAGRIFDRLVMNYGDQQILKDLDSIPLGVDFREYLGRMVGECDVLLAVIGPRWLDAEGDTSRLDDPRDFVRIEIESALTREIPVVPLFVGGASMPSEEDVPESIRPFVYRNGVPVRPDPDFHDDMDRVIAGLDGYGRPAPPPPAETVAPSWPERIPPADPDSHRDAEERERVRAEAELTKLADKLALATLADKLAEAEEHHRAEIAHLQTKAEEIRDAAARNAQATAEAHAHDTLAAELDRVRADAERARTDELAAAEARHRAEIARLETEAAKNRDAAIRDAQTAAEVRADETLAVKLDRVRADAERTLADELAAAEARHRAEIACLETEAAESRDARDAAEARADETLAAELDRVRADAEQARTDELTAAEARHRAETARLETEAAESRDAAIRDAQTAAEVRADETLAVKLDRVRADAERTLADELAAAEERHRAEIARLETEAAESRDTATRDAQARADAQADDRLTAELDRARAEAERTLADELAVAEKRHRAEIRRLETEAAEIRDAAASDIETLQYDAGMMETPTPTTAAQAPTILIVAEDEVQTVKSEPGFKTNIRVFADTDAIRALQCISRDRPRVVVLGRAFVDSCRGAGLVNAIKTDRTLANTQIRVISRASDFLCLVRRTGPQAASDDAMPGEPLPADYLGTRRTRRYKLRPGVEVRVDGHPTTLVDLSGTGARLAGSTVLRMKQQVRFVIGTAPEVVRCSGLVVWVSFEPQGKRAPRYTAGAQFIDADPRAIENLALRHQQN